MSEVAIDQRESPPLAETPDICGAYPRLSDDQIATLEAGGARRAVDTGETLVREVSAPTTSSSFCPARSPSPPRTTQAIGT
jgi:hypothetical protein